MNIIQKSFELTSIPLISNPEFQTFIKRERNPPRQKYYIRCLYSSPSLPNGFLYICSQGWTQINPKIGLKVCLGSKCYDFNLQPRGNEVDSHLVKVELRCRMSLYQTCFNIFEIGITSSLSLIKTQKINVYRWIGDSIKHKLHNIPDHKTHNVVSMYTHKCSRRIYKGLRINQARHLSQTKSS